MRAVQQRADGMRRASPVVSARRDLVTGGIVVAAILIFVGSGGSIARSILNAVSGVGGGADGLLISTGLLNVALMLFGWRRYRDLAREVAIRTAA
ncbi:MAG: diguanylate cyclase/phosphodiesterase, partial [Sphingomonas bacterium]|nr:diguanylate cyclase/phosphodiesterase [Sphingomonas bacterium]